MPILVPLCETHPVGSLGTGDDNLLDSELDSRLDHVVGRLRVRLERLVIGYEHVTRIGGEVDDGIRGLGRSGSFDPKLLHIEQRSERVEDLAQIGQVDFEGVDGYFWVGKVDEVEVEDVVALGDEVRDDMSTCLSTSACQDYSRHAERLSCGLRDV